MPIVDVPGVGPVDIPDEVLAKPPQTFGQKAEAALEAVYKPAAFTMSAVARGLATLPALALEAGIHGRGGFRGVSKAVKEFGVQPTTPGERVAARTIEGAAMGPMGVADAVYGALSGGVGELVQQQVERGGLQWLPEGARKWAPAVAGTAVALPQMAFPSLRERFAHQITESVSPEQLRAAAREMEEFPNTVLGQHLPMTSVAEGMQAAAASPYGRETRRMLQEQPAVVRGMSEEFVEGLPGKHVQTEVATNRAAKALTERVRQEQKAAGKAFQAELEPERRIPPGEVRGLQSDLQDFAARHEQLPIERIAEDAAAMLSPRGFPEAVYNRPDVIHSRLNEALAGQGPRTLEMPGVKASRMRNYAQVNDIIEKFWQRSSPDIQAAKAAYAKHAKEVVEPLKQETRAFTGVKGYEATKDATQTAFDALMNRGVDPLAKGGGSRIRTILRQINKVDPEISADLVKNWFSRNLGEAVKLSGKEAGGPLTAGRASQVMGLYSATHGPAPRATFRNQAIRDALGAVWEGKGFSKQQVEHALEGLGRMERYFDITSNVPGLVKGLPIGETKEMAKADTMAALAQASAVGPMWTAGKWKNFYEYARAMKWLDRVLTEPTMVEQLIRAGTGSRWKTEIGRIFAAMRPQIGADYPAINSTENENGAR